MNQRAFPVFVLLLSLIGCGGGRNPDVDAANKVPQSQVVGRQKAEVLSGGNTLQFTQGVLQGHGVVRFTEVLEKPESANNFSLKLELAEGQSVTLIVNSDRNLSAGVEIEISRPQGALTPKVVAKAGTDTLDLSAAFLLMNVNEEMSLSFDIHNDHGDSVHVLAWNAKTDRELFSDMIQGRGFGVNWGLKLNGAKVYSIEKSTPRDEH